MVKTWRYKIWKESPFNISAFKKYGIGNFSFYVLEECEKDINILNEREVYFINKYNSNNPEKGYNLTSGGGGVSGYTHNEERRRKISENTPKMNGEKHPFFGKHWDDEMKEHLRTLLSRENSPVFGTKHPNSISKYYGVGIHHNNTTKYDTEYSYIYWRARLRVDKKDILIGYFKTEIEAAIAYDDYVVDHKLKNPLNFPENYIDMA